MKYALWFELLRIPASTITVLLRQKVGMKIAPIWHFLTLCALFSLGYFFTKNEGFMWCGGMVILGLFTHCAYWIGEYLKGNRISTLDEGEAFDESVFWQKYCEPVIPIVGGCAAFYYQQNYLGVWVIFAGICRWLVTNQTVEFAAMQLPTDSIPMTAAPELTKTRITLALSIAVIADVIQIPITLAENTGFLMIPAAIADCVLDFCMMTAAVFLLGFDKLFLPSLFVEAIPEIDAFPTWTGCVAFVIWRRKKAEDSGTTPLEVIQELKIKPAVAAIEVIPPPALMTETGGNISIETKLSNLRASFQKGLIPQAEYDAKRRQLLSEL